MKQLMGGENLFYWHRHSDILKPKLKLLRICISVVVCCCCCLNYTKHLESLKSVNE